MQPLFSFLRPLALPRTSTINHFLRRTVATAAASASASTPSQTVKVVNRQSLPYAVARTPSNQFPVYLLEKRGGNLKQTKLRKIEGDVNVLRKDLVEALGLEDGQAVINQLTRHIIIKVRDGRARYARGVSNIFLFSRVTENQMLSSS
jgi:large subunit ribosomal protein L49